MNKKIFLIIIVFVLLVFIWFMKSKNEENIIETEKYKIDIYETDPEFEEIPVEDEENINDSIIE